MLNSPASPAPSNAPHPATDSPVLEWLLLLGFPRDVALSCIDTVARGEPLSEQQAA